MLPALGAGGDGTRAVLWVAGTEMRVRLARHGAAFGAERTVPGSRVKAGVLLADTSVTVGPSGRAVLAWRRLNDAGPSGRLRLALVRGDHVSRAISLGSGAADQLLGGVAFGSRGKVAVALQQAGAVYLDVGSSNGRFGPRELVAAAGLPVGVFYRSSLPVIVFARPHGAGADLVEVTRLGPRRFGHAHVMGRLLDRSHLSAAVAADGSTAALWATASSVFAAARGSSGALRTSNLESTIRPGPPLGTVATSAAGRALAAWTDGSGLVAASIRPRGGRFGPSIVVPGITIRFPFEPPVAALAPSGWGVVAWTSAYAEHPDRVRGLDAVVVGTDGTFGTVTHLVDHLGNDQGESVLGLSTDRRGAVLAYGLSGRIVVARTALARR